MQQVNIAGNHEENVQKLKIAVWHNLPSGGGKRALYQHVKGLTERGHTVEAWCPSSADTAYLPLGDFIKEHILPFDWEDPPASGRLQNLLYPYRAVQTKLLAMERHCALCAEQIMSKGFDVLFANSCMFFRVPPLGRMVAAVPSVLYLQEPYRWLYEALPKLPWLGMPRAESYPFSPKNLRRYLRDVVQLQGLRVQAREEHANAGAFGSILVNSCFSRESVLRAYGLDAQVCYLGVSGDVFRPSGATRENFAIGLGSFGYEKGIDVAIQALATIPEAKRPRLTWVGNLASKRYYGEMISLAASLGVEYDPKLNVSETELIDLLNRASVMLYTSRLEPFGFAPLEANACGTPVVAVAEGGVRETIHHLQNGLLVYDRDPVVLGRSVLTVMEDRELAHHLGQTGRKMVEERWSWETAVDGLEKQLAKAMAIEDSFGTELKI